MHVLKPRTKKKKKNVIRKKREKNIQNVLTKHTKNIYIYLYKSSVREERGDKLCTKRSFPKELSDQTIPMREKESERGCRGKGKKSDQS